MAMRLTRKDIMTTIAVLVAVFVGIPLALWGVSDARLAAFKNRTDELVRPVITETIANARLAAQAFADERVVAIDFTPRHQSYSWQRRDSYENIIENNYQNSVNAIDVACGRFRDALEKRTRDVVLGYYGAYLDGSCSFIIKTAAGYGEAQPEYFKNFDDSVDIGYIEALAASSDDLPINSHRDDRSVHFLVLVKKDPLVVWSLRVWSKDSSRS